MRVKHAERSSPITTTSTPQERTWIIKECQMNARQVHKLWTVSLALHS
jgi:hypothetical protein